MHLFNGCRSIKTIGWLPFIPSLLCISFLLRLFSLTLSLSFSHKCERISEEQQKKKMKSRKIHNNSRRRTESTSIYMYASSWGRSVRLNTFETTGANSKENGNIFISIQRYFRSTGLFASMANHRCMRSILEQQECSNVYVGGRASVFVEDPFVWFIRVSVCMCLHMNHSPLTSTKKKNNEMIDIFAICFSWKSIGLNHRSMVRRRYCW